MAKPSGIFRSEAIRALDEEGKSGDLLHLSPRWTRSAYWLLVFVLCGTLSFAGFATIGEYAAGAAVVRVDGKTDLTATAAGTVSSVEVQPGQRVAEGQVLVRFHNADEQAELARLESEFEAQLVRVLRDPNDQAARQAVTTLRAQKELAEDRVARRTVRAPRAGVVSDVRIRPGQLLAAGDLVVSLLGDDARFSLVAFLPGQYRPLLHAGMPLELRLRGFPRALEHLSIDSVADDVVGPTEAKRYLGPEVADALPVSGPVVVVKARLPAQKFTVDHESFSFYDGLPGTAEARVRSQRVLAAFLPGLRWILGDVGP